jgi:DNA-binding transcriptional ArsR family regulator
VDELGMSQPAVSQHLAVLRAAGLVNVEVDGRRRLYRSDNAAVARAGAFFAEYWAGGLDRLAMAAEGDARSTPPPASEWLAS